jgi:hypothetical protein
MPYRAMQHAVVEENGISRLERYLLQAAAPVANRGGHELRCGHPRLGSCPAGRKLSRVPELRFVATRLCAQRAHSREGNRDLSLSLSLSLPLSFSLSLSLSPPLCVCLRAQRCSKRAAIATHH